jgi:hypothetical protein
VLLAGVTVSAWADTPGTVAEDPFDLGTSAAIMGMGGASAAAPGGLWSLGYNPAGLADVAEWRFGLSYFNWIASSSVAYGSIGSPSGSAIGVVNFDQGSITVSDQFATMGSASVRDFGAIAGYGTELPGDFSAVRVGISAQYWQKNLAGTTAGTFCLNLGAAVRILEDQLTVGAYAQNLGPALKFETAEEDEQPLAFAGGVHWAMKRSEDQMVRLELLADVIKPRALDVQLAGGGQIVLNDLVALRAGANTFGEKTHPTFGLGISYKSFTFDYAFGTVGLLETDTTIHRVSFGFGPLLAQ